MREEDMPFVCYRRSRWHMQIRPRNAEGWRLLGMWMIPFFLLTAAHVAIVSQFADNDALVRWTTLGFAGLVLVWSFAMIRWMLARSVVITRK